MIATDANIIYLQDDSQQWKPIGCLNAYTFSENVEMLDTTAREKWETGIPTRQGYEIAIDCISKDDDYLNIKALSERKSVIRWKIGESYGKGHFTNVQINSEVDSVVDWSANLVSSGKVFDYQEFYTKPVYGTLNVFSNLLGALVSPREFWYLRGQLNQPITLIGVLSRFIDSEELVGSLDVNANLSATLTEEIIYTLLDATYESAFDFNAYYQSVFSQEGASVEDVNCFQKAIFDITENGGMLLNTTIVASLLSEVIFTEIRGNLNVDVDMTAEMIKTKIYTDIEGVLNQLVGLSGTLIKEKYFETLEGNIEIVVDASGDLSKTKIYTDIEGDLNITISIDGDLDKSVTTYSHDVSNNGESSGTDSCLFAPFFTTRYSDDSVLGVGSFIYTDIGLTTKFAGGNLWYKIGTKSYRIDNNGEIQQIFNC